jgi:hypothetical protein
VRKIIHEAAPEIVEEWKWMGTPVFSHGGIVCTGETYKNVVKMTFAKGAALQDPSGLFNSSLDGNVRRAIDIHEGDKIDEAALKDLIRAAVALNLNAKPKSKAKPKPKPKARQPSTKHQAGRLSNFPVGIQPPKATTARPSFPEDIHAPLQASSGERSKRQTTHEEELSPSPVSETPDMPEMQQLSTASRGSNEGAIRAKRMR